MGIFLETFLALSPLYFFMLAGALLRRTGIIADTLVQPLNRFVFKVFLPVSLFISAYNARLNVLESAGAIAFMVCSLVLLFVILMLIVPRFIRVRSVGATVIQGLFRSNFILLGFAYVSQLYGSESISEASILIAVVVPLYNVLSVIDFVVMSGGKPKFGTILIKVLKNPLVLAALLAFGLRLVKLQLPEILYNPLDSIADATTPLAMILVGASLTFQGFRENGKLIAGVTAARLILVPCIFVPIAVLLGFRNVMLITFLTAFAGPCAISSPAMACQLGGDGELASQFVAVTTAFSMLTIYLFIILLRLMGLC